MTSTFVNLPEVFTEESRNFAGSKTKGKRPVLNSTLERRKAEKTILKLAQENNIPISTVVTKILTESPNALRRYVVAHNETPEPTAIKLAVQAALIRANEIGTISKALDTDDNDSLLQIEGAEQEAVINSHPDAKNILPTDVQAALKLVLDRVSTQFAASKGSGKLKDFVLKMKQPNGFDLNIASVLNNPDNFDIGYIDPNYGQQWIESNTTNPPDTTNDIFSIFDKIVTGITKVTTGISGAATTVGDTVNGVLGGVSDTASDIGADSIRKAVTSYLPIIIGGLVAIVAIILIIVYASKRK